MSDVNISQAQSKLKKIRHIFLGSLIYGLAGLVVAVIRPAWMHSDSALVCLGALMVGMSYGGFLRAGELREILKD
jgi:hypothetical protein